MLNRWPTMSIFMTELTFTFHLEQEMRQRYFGSKKCVSSIPAEWSFSSEKSSFKTKATADGRAGSGWTSNISSNSNAKAKKFKVCSFNYKDKEYSRNKLTDCWIVADWCYRLKNRNHEKLVSLKTLVVLCYGSTKYQLSACHGKEPLHAHEDRSAAVGRYFHGRDQVELKLTADKKACETLLALRNSVSKVLR